MATATKRSDDAERVASARKLITTAKRKASAAARDPGLDRSTRSRRAMKLKAEALEEVGDVLAGKT